MSVSIETFRFFFWETLKVVSLASVGVVCAKVIAGLEGGLAPRQTRFSGSDSEPGLYEDTTNHSHSRTAVGIKVALYVPLFVMAALGARGIGNGLAAEIYFLASGDNLRHSQPVKAYTNALRAIKLRPGQVKYWQMLSTSKLALRQYESLLDDRPVLESLEGGRLNEQDAMRIAFAHFFLGQYDRAITIMTQLIKQNRLYPAAYVLLGASYTAEKRYAEAERVFLDVLQAYPTQEGAVEGLAHVYFLMGNPGRALAVLDQTARFPFDPDVRKRFEQLKALYRHGHHASQEELVNRAGNLSAARKQVTVRRRPHDQ